MTSVTVEFNQKELYDLSALINGAIRADGIPAAKVAIPLLEKIETAVAEVNAANAEASIEEAA
jgi:hypothetical protein